MAGSQGKGAEVYLDQSTIRSSQQPASKNDYTSTTAGGSQFDSLNDEWQIRKAKPFKNSKPNFSESVLNNLILQSQDR